MITKNKDIKKALDSYFTLLSSYQPVYSTYAGGIYEMELTRAAIHCFATHCSKLKPEVVGNAAPALGRVLQYQPNPIMDTKKYLYRLATCYMTDNNTLIAPLTEFDEVKGFYPLAVGKAQLVDHGGQTYVRYDMGGGEYFAVELARCGILNQFQYTSELWGESNLCLRPTLELLDAQNQGIINGIKNSAVIRFIAKLANSFKPKDVKEEQERLKEINLGISNTAGVFLIDQKYEDVKQIDSKPYIINPSQMEYIKQNVFTYFGTNEHILQNKFTPDEWNAYYEGKIEPFALELGLVHTNMTFTEREKSFGNQIFFSSNRLQYASISDKINYVVQMGDRGRTSINEDREVFNLPPVEDGDRHFIRGEYRPVDSYGEPVEPLPNGNEALPDGNTQAPISGNEAVDKAAEGGIIEARYSDDQPRDEDGKWTSGGGSSSDSTANDSGFEYKEITDDAINNVPKVSVFDDDEMNTRYQQANKDLLKEAQKHPVGTEVSIVYGADMKPIKGYGYQVGTEHGEVKIDNPDQLYHGFHNHPSGNTLSPDDVMNFTRHDKMLSMSAVGNDGRVYCLSKTESSNSAGYRLFMRDQCRQKRFLGKYSYFEVSSKTFDMSNLTDQERVTLQNQVSSFCESCASGGVFYGFKYTKK